MILQLWSNSNGEEQSVNWIIEDRTSHQAIGTIGLLNIEDKSSQCSIGYCLSKKFWDQGLMTEAVYAVLQYAFKMGLKTIIGYHDSRNVASGKVMVKNNMQYFESLNTQSPVDNTNIVLEYYKITSQDWKKIYGRKKD
jgi:RimJ/RimL family protein N-acetyltransferase